MLWALHKAAQEAKPANNLPHEQSPHTQKTKRDA